MGQLRSGLRACAMDDPHPAKVAGRVSALLRQLDPGHNATLLYLVLDALEGRLQALSAGHPAPLRIDPDGGRSFLDLPHGVPLGAVRHPAYEAVELDVAPDTIFLMFTDGVIERPGESLDAGLARLLDAAAGATPGSLCSQVVDTLLPRGARRDDAALLCAHVKAISDPLELALDAEIESIPVVRRLLALWLRDAGATRREIEEVALACSEACANAIEHAYGPAPAQMLVRAELLADQEAVVSVSDSGSWREPREGDQGRGTALMQGLMDAIETDRGPDGTTVRLRRQIGRDA
jgi:anti-sigma regulatory factor (Ser/Thr protein kinase)